MKRDIELKARLMLLLSAVLSVTLLSAALPGRAEPTYAERLGWPPDTKALIIHIDDAGMHHDANVGAMEAIGQGVATSASVMYPCPWVTEYASYLTQHPEIDAGIHLTLNSEWGGYRWGPLAGKKLVPSLVDPQGCLWGNPQQVMANATLAEMETELRAQVDRCQSFGLAPTHMDSHIFVLYQKPEYFELLFTLARELDIPILMAGGHMQCVTNEEPQLAAICKANARRVWDAGLPVIDDIHGGGFSLDPDENRAKFVEYMTSMPPGITQFYLHCAKSGPEFSSFTGCGPARLADLNLLLNPEIKKELAARHIVLTTWRELKNRRKAIR